jgi:hypothetical protein
MGLTGREFIYIKIRMILHPYKRFIIIFLFILGFIIIVSTFYLDIDTFNSTKKELKLLFETEFDNCMIKNVVEAKYPSSGYYKKFKVDCNAEYFPVLLENMTLENESYFQKGVIISKRKNDYLIMIKNNQNFFSVSARHTENEIGLGLITRVLVISLMILVPIFLFFIPGQYFKIE